MKKRKIKDVVVRIPNADYLHKISTGNRRTNSIFAMMLLQQAAQSNSKPVPFSEVIASIFLDAWKNRNVKFFSEIFTTLKRKLPADHNSDPAAVAVLKQMGSNAKRPYSLTEIQNICRDAGFQISKRKAGRIRLGLKIKSLPWGNPKLAQRKKVANL